MRLIAPLFIALLLAGCSATKSQTTTTTIILVRHAEKDTVGGKDPQLTTKGIARAEKLPTLFKNLPPDLLYSTPYVRTRQTLIPWAKKTGLPVKDYDPANLEMFAAELKTLQGKTIVVAGHSNTTPALVNYLIGNQKYQSLPDDDYSKLWVITIKNGTVSDKIVEY